MNLRPDEVSSVIKKQIQAFTLKLDITQAGSVIHVGDGIVRVHGLENAMVGEILAFPNEVYGIALNLDEDSIGAVLMGSDAQIMEGDSVRSTGRVAEMPVGDALLGRVVNALGQPIDQKGPIESATTRRVERVAPGVITRREVHVPMQTGIKAID
ncbi:MAG: F0F1 ATP synthase subunit alpha, partial [Clostridiales bacterium]|nr:F0F1 ATP synthase subunit alpha [Clostridiales bacterium]